MPKSTVVAIIHPAGGNRRTIILTRRNINPINGLWCLPGGHIEDFEPAEITVRREAKEEANFDFAPKRFVGWFEEILPKHRFHAVALAFAGAGSGALQKQPDKVSEMAWFSLAVRLFLVRF
jgi:8-oxo-dGTP diphosphatase